MSLTDRIDVDVFVQISKGKCHPDCRCLLHFLGCNEQKRIEIEMRKQQFIAYVNLQHAVSFFLQCEE